MTPGDGQMPSQILFTRVQTDDMVPAVQHVDTKLRQLFVVFQVIKRRRVLS